MPQLRSSATDGRLDYRHYSCREHHMFRAKLILLATLAISSLSHSLLRGEDLFRLVQPEATVCLQASGLADNWQRLEGSEFAARLQESPFWAEIAENPKLDELTNVRNALESVLQRPLREVAESLFGRNVVLAMYASSAGETDHVVLLEADSAKSIEFSLAAWQLLDAFEPVEFEYRGVKYKSLNKPGRADNRNPLVVQFDHVLAIAQRPERLKRIIDARLDAESESLAIVEPFAEAAGARPKTELAAVYVNPRSLDSAVAYFITNPEQPPFMRRFAWSRCQWLTVRLLLDSDRQALNESRADDLKLEVVADYDSQDAPEWWDQWVDLSMTQRLPLDRIPKDALLSLSGQFSADAVQTLIRNNVPADGDLPSDLRRVRRVGQGLLLGFDPLSGLLPALGPNWLAYSVPRSSAEAADFPVDALVALELHPEKASALPVTEPGTVPQPSMQDALDNVFLTGLNLLAAEHNSRTSGPVAVVRHKAVGEGTIRWAEPVSKFRPAYAVSNNFVLVASSPELCEQFLESGSARTSKPALAEKKAPTEPTQYWLARSTVARQLLESHRDWFLWQARRDQIADDEADRRLKELDSVLKLADEAELSASLTDSKIRASVSLSAVRAAE